MTVFGVNVIRKADPMIVVKAQATLEHRMDPGYWAVEYIQIDKVLRDGSLELCRFGKFVTHEGQGDTPRKHLGEYFQEEGFQFFSAEDILPSGLDLHNYKFISKGQHQRLSRTELKVGDILFARIGVASTGRVAIVTRLPGPSNINNSLDVFRVQGISPYYVVCFLKSYLGQKQVERLKSGVASTAIAIKQIKSIQIPRLVNAFQYAIENEYKTKIEHYHDEAMDAKGRMLQAHKYDNKAAEERYRAEYEHNITIAEAMLNDLVRQVEEIIEGTRTEIEPVDRILNEEQGYGA